MLKSNITYKISNNDDWKDIKQNEELVDISNDAYFGFRAMEANAKMITYDLSVVKDFVRLGKESKKFPGTTHVLLLDDNTLGFEATTSEEEFMKLATREIEKLIQLNEDIKLDFIIETNLNKEFIYETLIKIYKKA